MLTLTTGQEVKNLLIRLQAAAVVRGRVTDEDGDPMASAQVTVLRQTFTSGRSRWEPAGSERTNDLGEYRIPNLPAGNYYVSVNPPPDFKSLIEAAGNAAAGTDPSATKSNAPDKTAALSYQTTYYPGTPDRSQAAPIQLKAGDDFPVDFSLAPSPALIIRGSVVNLPPRSSATIMLQSHDFNLMLNDAEIHKDGTFVIRDVAPCAYTVLATVENGAGPLMARQSLQVAGNVEDLRLAPQPGGWIHGRLRLESKGNSRIDPGELFLMLRTPDGDDDLLGAFSFRDAFSDVTHVAADGSFEWKSVPPGSYYVHFAGGGLGPEWYLKSVLVGGHDADEAGISVSGGAVVLDLVASSSGAALDGVVTNQKGEPVANAVIVAVPEVRLRGRMDRYHKTVSDQAGRFTLQGIAPGEYTLFAWESVDGDAYYNAEFLKSYAGQGIALHASEGQRKSISLQVIPDADALP